MTFVSPSPASRKSGYDAEQSQAIDTRMVRRPLLLPSSKAQALSDAAESETAEQLVDTQTTKQTIDKSAKTQAVEEFADQAQDTAEEQADSSDDLEERLAQEIPERVEFLLCVWHIGQLLLGVLDGCDDGGGELLEGVGQLVLFLCRFS